MANMPSVADAGAAPGHKEMIVDEPVIVLRLQLSSAEVASLLMAQITQARQSRLTLGEDNPSTQIDHQVLEKLMTAQRRALSLLAGTGTAS